MSPPAGVTMHKAQYHCNPGAKIQSGGNQWLVDQQTWQSDTETILLDVSQNSCLILQTCNVTNILQSQTKQPAELN